MDTGVGIVDSRWCLPSRGSGFSERSARTCLNPRCVSYGITGMGTDTGGRTGGCVVSRGSLSAKTDLMVATRWRAESSLIFLESDDGAGVGFVPVE